MDTTAIGAAKTPRFSWFVLALLYLAAIAAPLSMFKVGILAPNLIPILGLDPTQIGLMMSVFNFAGFILAIPAGFLIAKMGAKRAILISLLFTVLGSVLGAFGTTFEFLCFTRVLEGVGLGLVTVSIPSAIAEWFPMKRRGLALGVFTTYVPIGQVIGLALYPSLEASLGWTSVWWFAAIFGAVIFFPILFLYRRPRADERLLINAGVEVGEIVNIPLRDSAQVFKNRNVWLAGFIFMCFNFVTAGGAGQYITIFFTSTLGVSLTIAGLFGVIVVFSLIIFEPAMGAVSDKVGSRKIIVVVPLAAMFILAYFIFFTVPVPLAIILYTLLNGVFAAGVASGTFASAPEITGRPEDASMVLSVIALFQNLGLIIGPIVFAQIYAPYGFLAVAHYWFMPVLAVAFVVALFIKYRAVPKKGKSETEQ